ncbi:hypothetical protein J2Z50_003604 [Ensifer mexicanus]|nr:hypothetical protein [Sinorhizobium mexicanum]
MIAADAAGAHDDRSGRDLKVTDDVAGAALSPRHRVRLEYRPARASHHTIGRHQFVHPVAKAKPQQAAAFRLPGESDKGFENGGTGAPGHVEARNRIAMAVGEPASAFGPADHREPAKPKRMQPGALLAGGEVEIGIGPEPRPMVFGPIESRRTHPVLPREIAMVANSHAPLLGTVDEEQSSKRPESLATEVLLPLLIENDHLAATGHSFGRRHEPGKARTDDQHITIHERRPPYSAVRLSDAQRPL